MVVDEGSPLPIAAPRSRRQDSWDAALGTAALAIALAVHVSGIEAVAANRPVGVLSISLTVAAVGPLVGRRRRPLLVLGLTLLGIVALIATESVVGLATLGPLVAFYTAAASRSRRDARSAVVMLFATAAISALLRPVDLSPEGALVSGMLFIGARVLARGTREHRERSAAEVVAAEQRTELERNRADVERERAANATVRERLRISREVHDVIGHALSVMVVQAGVAERLLDGDPTRARAAIGEIGRTGRGSLDEMRRLLGVLRADDDGDDSHPKDRPGATATLSSVPELATRLQAAGLPVDVTVRGQRGNVPAGVELAAYRIVQEALTNSLRHANASRAAVRVTYEGNGVELEIVDDGQQTDPAAPTGAEPAHTPGRVGHGLPGMRERVAIYGGELFAGPRPEGGFLVRARFPGLTP